MAESPRPHDQPETAGVKRGIRWDAMAAIIASLVGLLALIVAGYTAYIQREQVRAQVWPYVELGDSTSTGNTTKSKDFAALVASNKGVGPAIVRRVEILVNGSPEPDRSAIIKAMGVDVTTVDISHSTLSGSVLSPDETREFLVVSGEPGAIEFSAHMKDVIMRACYASTLGERWIATADLRGRFGVRPARSCASIPKADEFRG